MPQIVLKLPFVDPAVTPLSSQPLLLAFAIELPPVVLLRPLIGLLYRSFMKTKYKASNYFLLCQLNLFLMSILNLTSWLPQRQSLKIDIVPQKSVGLVELKFFVLNSCLLVGFKEELLWHLLQESTQSCIRVFILKKFYGFIDLQSLIAQEKSELNWAKGMPMLQRLLI